MSDKETVTVGCKVPGGLRLHVMKRVDKAPIMLDPPVGFQDLGFIDLPRIAPPSAPGVPAKTESFAVVDKELWEIWLAENAESSLVTGGSVFKYEEPKAAEPADEPVHEEEREHVAEDLPGGPVVHGDSPVDHIKEHKDLSDEELDRLTNPGSD